MKLVALKKTLSVRSTFSQRSNADESRAAGSVISKKSSKSFKRLMGGNDNTKQKEEVSRQVPDQIKESFDDEVTDVSSSSSSDDNNKGRKIKNNLQSESYALDKEADDDASSGYYIPWYAGKDGNDEIKIIHTQSSKSSMNSKAKRFGVAKSRSTIDTDPLLDFKLSSFTSKASGEDSSIGINSSVSSASSMGSGQFNLTSLAMNGGYNSECLAEQLNLKKEASRSALADDATNKKHESLAQQLLSNSSAATEE